MSERLKDRVAIVTGASRGIGRAIALSFGREGASVCVNYSASATEATEVVKKIEAAGQRAIGVRADVAETYDAQQMVGKVLDEFGTVDILVNNAGISRPASVLEMKADVLDEMYRVNLRGTLNCILAVQEHMVKMNHGKIVNVASIAGMGTAFKGTTLYAVTKAGVLALTKRFALELGRYNINVNGVAPGFIDTKMNRNGKTPREFSSLSRRISQRSMLGRIGKPEDIANAVLFLASDESAFVTGQVLTVDGGRTDFLSHSM